MKVLHDWDDPYLHPWHALRRALYLILYAASTQIPILNRIPRVAMIREETREHADTLAKLDALVGIEPIFGIRDTVSQAYPDIINELTMKYRADVRRHIHIGCNSDPARVRTWEPIDGLEAVTARLWHFDRDYANGNPVELNPDEVAVWHVDYPRFLKHYINWLYGFMPLLKHPTLQEDPHPP